MYYEKKMSYSINDLENVVDYVMTLSDTCQVFTLTGSLGAGKTTLIQAILRRFGVEGVITSPTFTYVNIYEGSNHEMIYHFDCYRIPTLDLFLEAGFGEYLYQPNSLSFIEWPEVVSPLLTHNVCHMTIDYEGIDKRTITFMVVEEEDGVKLQ
jgi:tRNA threonylcarbamoyladenosine biosynthesis protein TsaE